MQSSPPPATVTRGALIPWEPQVRKFVARHQALLENLIELLQTKGQLSAAEVEGLRLQADATWRSHQLEFFEVEDIDAIAFSASSTARANP